MKKKKISFLSRAAMMLFVMMLTASTAWATTTSTINVGGTDYTLFTGFTATSGTNVSAAAYNYPNLVDGNLDGSSSWHLNNDNQPYYIEFNSDDPIIPKGYIFNTFDANNFKPTGWRLMAKADSGDSWTTLSSKSGQSLASEQEFQYACDNNGNNAYKYFRFEVSNSSNNIWLTEIRLYGSIPNVYYTHLTVKAATCTETGIKQDCYQRNDGKYFTDETGATELAESDVIAPMIPHSGEHHEATDVNIEYWQCSMCGKYFSDEGYTTEIIEEQTKIYRTITIDDGISSLVTSSVDKALAGATVTLTISHLIDANTLKVNNGSVTLTDEGDGTYTFIVPAADIIVTASILSTYSVTLPANMAIVSATNAADPSGKYISGTVIKFAASVGYEATNVSDGTNTLEPDANGIYTVTVAEADINITATTESSNTIYLAGATSDFTAVGGYILIGSTDYTVTIADGANITLNNATINGGVICEGSATITLVGTNSISNTEYNSAGIQIGGSGTTLTIKGDGSLNVTGGSTDAGIGLGKTWDENATAGSVVIESGTITASGDTGIGIGTVGNYTTAHMDGIIIKGGTVSAKLGSGYIYYGSSVTIGAIKIYDTIDKVDASTITESVTYMHVENETETDVTATASTYFTIIEDGDRRVITPKDDTDYTITIADDIEHGSIACAAETAKYGDKVTITATPDFGYRLSRLVVKDAENTDLASISNTFFMPKGNVTVSAVFEQGTHGTTEFKLMYSTGFQQEHYESIYDGLTTINLQQGQSYQIMYDEYSYRAFLLDNDTYDATIPYSSGTGTFPEYENGTNFRVDNNSESGFYDITMTDAGNGKWNVSILKTAGQMDVVPDQTYTGSEITPEPLVIAGSLSLTKGTDYVYSYENNTDVGTATVRATFQGDYASLGYVEKTFTIANYAASLADNADNTNDINNIITNYDSKADVTLSDRTLYKDGNWNTLCLPFDVTIADSPLAGDDVTAKVLNATESSLDNNGILKLKFSAAPATIAAGTPFIVKWNNTGIDLVNPVFSGVTVNNAATSVEFGDGNASFVGTYSPFAITDENIRSILLLTSSGKLGYSKVNRTLGSCRAYLQTISANAVREFVVDLDGETTNIQQVESGKLKVEGYYDLQGRKVAQPTKGLYIVNGKKAVIK